MNLHNGTQFNLVFRSPSPEPIYNSDGKRLNTREYRTRKTLEEDRHRLITRSMNINPEYKPPPDYKPPVIRVNDKVMIPQELHPDINFVGLLIGPRGNTLKNLEKDTGAKIIIRGKGSVKEGKIGRKDGQPLPGEDEPLHAYVTASNPENVKKAVEKINEIIRQGIEVPEGQNDLRRQQLRELAQLNGTLRENDALGKLKQMQQAQSIITNTIFCSVCGGTGHLSQDCKQKRPGDTLREAMQNAPQAPPPVNPVDRAHMDSEYMSLMAELGEGPPPPKQQAHHQRMLPSMGHQQHHQQHMPPWQGGGGGGPNRGGGVQRPMLMPPPSMSQPGPPGLRPPSSQSSVPPLMPPSSQAGHSQHGMMQSQPPPLVPPPTSMNSGSPWSQNVPTSSHSQGGHQGPPGMMAPPPPPPGLLTSQAGSFPWQQQQQSNNMVPPPPPPPTSNSSPWQNGGVRPVPPPPPSNPWQQNSGPSPVPPPPPGSQGYQHSHGYGGMGMPPPPPPN